MVSYVKFPEMYVVHLVQKSVNKSMSPCVCRESTSCRCILRHLRPRYDKTGLRTSYTFLLYLSDCAVGGGFGILADYFLLESWKLQDGCAKMNGWGRLN